MSAHLYWRIYITENNSGSFTAVVEIEMRHQVGGTNDCSGGTPLYSTQYASSGANSAAAAFDVNNTTEWLTSGGNSIPSYIGYQFPAPIEIAQVSIRGANSSANYSIKSFQLQWSDDNSSWTTVLSVSGQTGWGAAEQRLFTANARTISGNITESSAITDWLVTAIDCASGLTVGSTIATGSTYSMNCSTAGPHIITISPKIMGQWSASKVIALNDYYVPSSTDTNPRLYKATSIGSSPNKTGTSEPTWPTSGTVSDGDITWTFIDNLPSAPISLGPK